MNTNVQVTLEVSMEGLRLDPSSNDLHGGASTLAQAGGMRTDL